MATQKRMSISGNLMVLNEAHNMPRVVANLLEFCDEIVILDGGSTDGTVEYIVSLHDPRIKLYVWPQKTGSEYDREWDEPARRTLMMRLSEGDYILWLDADECMDDSFVNFIKNIKSKNVVCFLPMYQFWKSLDCIRVNTGGDGVWYPAYHLRLFPNSESFSCHSYRKDKLHPKTVKKVFGINVPIGLRYIYFSRRLSPLFKMLAELILGVKFIIIDDIHVFHYHYFDGYKLADLRSADKDKKEEFIDDINGDLSRDNIILLKKVDVPQPKAFSAHGK